MRLTMTSIRRRKPLSPMLSKNLTITTDILDAFFAGPSRTGSIEPWSLNLFSDERTEGGSTTWSLGFGAELGGRKFLHAVSLPTSSKGPEYPAELLLRIICHALVDQIPDAGLPELCETTNELLEFYSLPESWGKGPSLPAGQAPVSGAVVRTYERSPFAIQED